MDILPGYSSFEFGAVAGSKSSLTRPGLLLAVLGLAVQPAAAQDWEFDPFVEFVVTHTDNLYLAQDGLETTANVGQANPGFSLARDDGRFTTNTAYRLQSIFFFDDSDLNTVYHQLDADATIEVASDTFFVDLDATIDQSVVDPSRPIPTTNIAATENLGNVFLANANPYLVQQLGTSEAYFRADYTWGIGRYDDFSFETFSRVDDYTQELWSVYLGTSESDTGFEWSVTYDDQDVDFDVITDYKYERAGAAIGIPLGRSFRLVALGGLETDMLAGRNIGGLDSDYWEAGFRVNTGQSNVFEFRAGERFFGTSYFGNIQYEGRVVSASITYSENPTTSALEGPGSNIEILSVTEGDPVFDSVLETDEIIVVPIRAEAYISKWLRARVEFSGGRSLLYLAYFDEEREFIDRIEGLEGDQDGQSAVTAGFRYELGPRTDLEISAAIADYEYVDTDVQSDVKRYEVEVTRQLGADTELLFAYRYADQGVNNVSGFGNYVENAFDLGLVFRF